MRRSKKGRIMHKLVRLLLAFGLALAPLVFAAPATAATLEHTWVASTGSDSNNCDRPTPCADFQTAYNKTTAGGEITCVDGGNFYGINITHSITVNCEGAVASNTQPGGADYDLIVVNVAATDSVVLQGLDLDGQAYSPGGFGNGNCEGRGMIEFTGAGALHVHKMKINHYSLACGILFAPNGAAKLDVVDSYISDNGSSGTGAGIYILPASSVQAEVTITRTQIEHNWFGIIADGTQGGSILGTITDSVVSGSTYNGVTVSSTGSSVVFEVDRTTVAGNFHGLVAGGSGAGMLISSTGVFNNSAGLFTTGGGVLYSYGNNRVNGNNGNDGSFTGTVGLQ
jgi:hypothetical protein